jgi:amino acid transporter
MVRPNRTILRAIGIPMLTTTGMYEGFHTAAQGMHGPALAASTVPLARAGMSMFGYLGSDTLGSPRLLLTGARDGLLPRVLSQLHPRTRAPTAGWVYATIASVRFQVQGGTAV